MKKALKEAIHEGLTIPRNSFVDSSTRYFQVTNNQLCFFFFKNTNLQNNLTKIDFPVYKFINFKADEKRE